MYSTKSFCNVLAFVSNEPGVVSPIGELTTYAQTFTKELAVFHHTSQTLSGYDLLNFSSNTDGVKSAMPGSAVDQAVALVDSVVKMTLGTSGELFHDEVLTALRTFSESIAVIGVEMGPMATNGTNWVPEWISWSDSDPAAGANTHKVWLALEAFKAQYTDYEIVVVPPFDDLNIFFNPGSIVESRIKAITPTQMMEAVEAVKDGNPETLVRSDAYQYQDPVNTARKVDVYWTVVIYGPAGNDPDIIRDRLVDYVLANSTHSREEWAAILPDIFKRTEFVMAPFWSRYAAEQRIFDHGVYSPILDSGAELTWLEQYANGYLPDHIGANAQVMGFPYRSVLIATIGHPENRDGMMRITDFYPDFINVGTESTDFGRMSIPTQEWAVMMMEMITLAEKLDNSTDLPKGYYRVVRGGLTYVGKSYNRVLYLVLAKSNTLLPAPPAA